ncbi:MAG: Flagellar protein FliS [Pelotomaculum sp. PtaU1.Bin035]|nr:MAG: Flagellar protein FliS [Pelotomaculum sp. PtaU1.Bin035]
MINSNPYQRYQQNAVTSANKGELTLMLYTGAVKFIKLGMKLVEEKNIEGANNTIIRVQEIISHLNDTLNMEYELSNNLALLYDYINRRLAVANAKKDKQILGEVLSLVEELRDTWAEALKLAVPASAVNL